VTSVALADARERGPGGPAAGLIQELRCTDLEGQEILRRAARLGVKLGRGAIATATEMRSARPREALAVIAAEHPEAISELIDGRLYALLPASDGEGEPHRTVSAAAALADRLRSYGPTASSSFYVEPGELRRAVQEAEIVLDVVSRDDHMAEQLNGGTSLGVYRLLFRALASNPDEVRSFYEDTVAPVVRYDEQYRTELLATLQAYLAHDCNMNATARVIYAHRHTVAYRLARVRELSGLDPMVGEDRERLGLGLKAHRIVAPTLPR
jgi:PucR family transcriptional regulator, purine catabolism regulatory protein